MYEALDTLLSINSVGITRYIMAGYLVYIRTLATLWLFYKGKRGAFQIATLIENSYSAHELPSKEKTLMTAP